YRQMLKTCWFMVTSRLMIGDIFAVTPFEGTELYRELENTHQLDKTEDQKFDSGAYHYRVSRLTSVPTWLIFVTLRITLVLTYINPVRMYKVVTRFPYPAGLPRRVYCVIMRVLGRKVIKRENIFQELRAAERSGKSRGPLALSSSPAA
ncbi:MAG: hypothetical protein K8I00_02500, partial [Candidatus Omnitrophica bacterium]|nr:hypothetical protein [Candidatus Omnitrophota bacterium]